MKAGKAVRYQGRLSSWKDEQGYGFITPNGGGEDVFVHIKSFQAGHGRPALDEIVTYELGVNAKGQPRAENVAPVRVGAARQPAARGGAGSILLGLGFLAGLGLAAALDLLPALVPAVYLGLSILTFCIYAADKSAARNERRRTPEDTLHLLAVAGGWPGALVAQQLLRHKSKKQSFRTMFWITVVVNGAALAWLLSPSGARLLWQLGGMA